MKNEKLHISVWLAAGILLAGTTSGCTKRSLSQRPSDGPLKIEFVWPGETAAAKAVPTGAQVLLYGSDGSLFRTVQCSAEGHECRVPADTYTVLVVNSDRSNAVCDQEESHRDCCVVAADDPDNENAVRHVDNVYCIGEERVEVKPGNTATTVTLYPQDVVKRIRFSIDPDYIDDIESLGLGMTGVVPSVCLKDCSDAQDGTKNIRAEAQPEGTTGLYTARMSVFGWRGRNIVTAAGGSPNGGGRICAACRYDRARRPDRSTAQSESERQPYGSYGIDYRRPGVRRNPGIPDHRHSGRGRSDRMDRRRHFDRYDPVTIFRRNDKPNK